MDPYKLWLLNQFDLISDILGYIKRLSYIEIITMPVIQPINEFTEVLDYVVQNGRMVFDVSVGLNQWYNSNYTFIEIKNNEIIDIYFNYCDSIYDYQYRVNYAKSFIHSKYIKFNQNIIKTDGYYRYEELLEFIFEPP